MDIKIEDSRIQYEYASGSDTDTVEDLLETTETKFMPHHEEMYVEEQLVRETINDIQTNSINEIEAVFLESDEDEGNPEIIEVDQHTDIEKLFPKTTQPVQPFRVRSIPPSKLTANMMSNSQTIALHSNDSDPKKFLVIPKEVMPMLSKSKGPVTLNLPGIGSVIIQKPYEIFKPKSQPRAQPKPPPEPKEKQVFPTLYDPLSDSKYSCWRLRKNIKRDLEGFSMSDRQGFYKAEQQRAVSCHHRCNEIVNSIFHSIHLLKRQKTALEQERLRKIAQSVSKEDTSKEKSSITSAALTPIQKKNLDTIISWKKRFLKRSQDVSSDSDYAPDMPRPKPKRRNKKTAEEYKTFSSKKKAKPKASYSRHESSDSDEIEIENKVTVKKTDIPIECEQSNSDLIDEEAVSPKKRGRPRKLPQEETPIKVVRKRPNILRKSSASENIYAKTYNSSLRRKN